MRSLGIALWVEILKVRKSRLFWGSFVFFVFVSSMMALVMFVQMYPGISGKLGMIGNKASMMRFGEPNWENYFKLLIQGFAGVGLVGMGFVTSWVFGREFSDHTLKDILVVPVSRTSIVMAKSIVVIVWSIILSILYFAAGTTFGFMIGMPGYSGDLLIANGNVYFITALLTIILFTPVAFLASWSRGYIIPLAFVILTMIIANFSGLVGLGPYFPWAIPGLYGTASATESMQVSIVSYIILFATSIAGFYGTVAWWKYADQK